MHPDELRRIALDRIAEAHAHAAGRRRRAPTSGRARRGSRAAAQAVRRVRRPGRSWRRAWHGA